MLLRLVLWTQPRSSLDPAGNHQTSIVNHKSPRLLSCELRFIGYMNSVLWQTHDVAPRAFYRSPMTERLQVLHFLRLLPDAIGRSLALAYRWTLEGVVLLLAARTSCADKPARAGLCPGSEANGSNPGHTREYAKHYLIENESQQFSFIEPPRRSWWTPLSQQLQR